MNKRIVLLLLSVGAFQFGFASESFQSSCSLSGGRAPHLGCVLVCIKGRDPVNCDVKCGATKEKIDLKGSEAARLILGLPAGMLSTERVDCRRYLRSDSYRCKLDLPQGEQPVSISGAEAEALYQALPVHWTSYPWGEEYAAVRWATQIHCELGF